MTGSNWNSLTAATAAVFTGLVFAHAAWHKLADFGAFMGFVADYQVTPEPTVASVSRAVDSKCEYWAYCSMNGIRCDACGGSAGQCPPGSRPSVVSWVGTCTNPTDKKAYLISYNDCCGKAVCDVPEDAFCSHDEGDRPGYRIGSYNAANWCMANTNLVPGCSTAVIVGIADGA
jgi:methylamine dehydrogenase light chain